MQTSHDQGGELLDKPTARLLFLDVLGNLHCLTLPEATVAWTTSLTTPSACPRNPAEGPIPLVQCLPCGTTPTPCAGSPPPSLNGETFSSLSFTVDSPTTSSQRTEPFSPCSSCASRFRSRVTVGERCSTGTKSVAKTSGTEDNVNASSLLSPEKWIPVLSSFPSPSPPHAPRRGKGNREHSAGKWTAPDPFEHLKQISDSGLNVYDLLDEQALCRRVSWLYQADERTLLPWEAAVTRWNRHCCPQHRLLSTKGHMERHADISLRTGSLSWQEATGEFDQDAVASPDLTLDSGESDDQMSSCSSPTSISLLPWQDTLSISVSVDTVRLSHPSSSTKDKKQHRLRRNTNASGAEPLPSLFFRSIVVTAVRLYSAGDDSDSKADDTEEDVPVEEGGTTGTYILKCTDDNRASTVCRVVKGNECFRLPLLHGGIATEKPVVAACLVDITAHRVHRLALCRERPFKGPRSEALRCFRDAGYRCRTSFFATLDPKVYSNLPRALFEFRSPFDCYPLPPDTESDLSGSDEEFLEEAAHRHGGSTTLAFDIMPLNVASLHAAPTPSTMTSVETSTSSSSSSSTHTSRVSPAPTRFVYGFPVIDDDDEEEDESNDSASPSESETDSSETDDTKDAAVQLPNVNGPHRSVSSSLWHPPSSQETSQQSPSRSAGSGELALVRQRSYCSQPEFASSSSGLPSPMTATTAAGGFTGGGATATAAPNSFFDANFDPLLLLGRGATGAALLVRHRVTGNFYAVKVLIARDYKSEQEILQEVRLHSVLQHENLVRYYASWSELVTPKRAQQLAFVGLVKPRELVMPPSAEVHDLGQTQHISGGLSARLPRSLLSRDKNSSAQSVYSQSLQTSSGARPGTERPRHGVSMRRVLSAAGWGNLRLDLADLDARGTHALLLGEDSLTTTTATTTTMTASSAAATRPRPDESFPWVRGRHGARPSGNPRVERIHTSSDDGGDSSRGSTTGSLPSSSTSVSSDEELDSQDSATNYRRARPAARRSPQPSVIGSHVVFLQMEFCQMTLAQYLASRVCIDRVENLVIALQLLRGLSYLHDNSVIHRDIKPTNIFVDFHCQMLVDNTLTRLVTDDDLDEEDEEDSDSEEDRLLSSHHHVPTRRMSHQDPRMWRAEEVNMRSHPYALRRTASPVQSDRVSYIDSTSEAETTGDPATTPGTSHQPSPALMATQELRTNPPPSPVALHQAAVQGEDVLTDDSADTCDMTAIYEPIYARQGCPCPCDSPQDAASCMALVPLPVPTMYNACAVPATMQSSPLQCVPQPPRTKHEQASGHNALFPHSRPGIQRGDALPRASFRADVSPEWEDRDAEDAEERQREATVQFYQNQVLSMLLNTPHDSSDEVIRRNVATLAARMAEHRAQQEARQRKRRERTPTREITQQAPSGAGDDAFFHERAPHLIYDSLMSHLVRVKLGDFGLAKVLQGTAYYRQPASPLSSSDPAGPPPPQRNPSQAQGTGLPSSPVYTQEKSLHQQDTIGIGSPLYASPEQFQGDAPITVATDAFSLGVVLAEMYIQPKTISERLHVLQSVRTGAFPTKEDIATYPELMVVRNLTRGPARRRMRLDVAHTKLKRILLRCIRERVDAFRRGETTL